MSKKSSDNQSPNNANIAVLVSLVTLTGVIVTAFLNYLSTRTQIELPMHATQTAEAKMVNLVSPTSGVLTSPTEITILQTVTPTQIPIMVFGPVDGQLKHNPELHEISTRYTKLYLTDFILDIEFFNPYGSNDGEWSYGIGFRETAGNQNYRIIVFSNSIWSLYLAGKSDDGNLGDQVISGGYIKNLNTSAGGSNRLRLIVKGNDASLLVNDILISTLDVSAKRGAGALWIGTGFLTDQLIEGKFTEYKNLTVWAFP